MMTKRLTDAQRKMVDENHNLIYWYIHENNLSIEEHYDLLAIELCNAVMGFDPTKGALSTLAKTFFNRGMLRYHRHNSAQKRTCNSLVSYDNLVPDDLDDDSDTTFLELFAAPIDDPLVSVTRKEWMERLDDRERYIMEGVIAGRRKCELAESLGISRSTVQVIMKRCRWLWNRYCVLEVG